MTSITVVVITLNEGESLRLTVDNLLSTLPPSSGIIVVDDHSTDQSTGFLSEGYPTVKLLRPDQRLGVAGARNFGASHATGDVLVFSDAHVITPPGWPQALRDVLARPEVGAVAPAISMLQASGAGSTGYGQKWTDATLAVEWLNRKGNAPYPVPLLCGCFLALRRDVFTQLGGFDAGLIQWGSEDSEISIRLWTSGFECWVVPTVEVQHAFRARFPYEVKWEPVLHNRLRTATLHFGPRRLRRVVDRLKHYDEFAAASVRLLLGDTGALSATFRAQRRHDDDWFFDRFPDELRSELSALSTTPSVTITASHQPCVTACLLSWKRPQNLERIIQTLRRVDCIDEILIWNNNPEVTLEFADPNTRVIQSGENQNCYGRFLCAAQARNPVVYVQDDDALNLDIPGLYEHYLRDPQRIAHALAPTHWPQRNRRTYGDSQAALVGWGAFFRQEWLSVLDDLPKAVRRDPLFLREADTFFSMLLERSHNAVPGQIEHLDGHSTPGIALWLDIRHQELAALGISYALRLLRRKKCTLLAWNVVIPSYNYGHFLPYAVESVLANDADYEIHIVDDASSDHTSEIAADFARRYPFIKHLRNETQRGPGYTRNRGIEAVESSYVVLLDADDRFGPDYLFEAAKVLRQGADVVNPDANLFGENQDRWIVPELTTLRMLLERNSVHYCSAFRRDLWSRIGGIDEDMPCWMDYEFWIRAAAAGARIQGLHGDHFFYRQHQTNLTTTANTLREELQAYLRTKHATLYQHG